MIDLALLRTAQLEAKLLRDIGVGDDGRVSMSDPRVRRIQRHRTGELLVRGCIRVVNTAIAIMQRSSHRGLTAAATALQGSRIGGSTGMKANGLL